MTAGTGTRPDGAERGQAAPERAAPVPEEGGSAQGLPGAPEGRAVGQRVKQARKAAGLTQLAVAEAIGVTAASVSRWESGDRGLDATDLVRLADVLGVEPASFLPGHAAAPAGEFSRVQIKGYQEYTGYLSEGTACGAPYWFLRDRDGRLVARFPPDSVHLITPALDLATLVQPERPALSVGDPWQRECECEPGEFCDECREVVPFR